MAEFKPLAPLFLLSDEPIDSDAHDDLGREEDARLLAELVLGTRGPFTVGVYGDWGIGKTSLLNRVRHLLAARDENQKLLYPYIVPVFFNAWQYENEEKPLAHLAEAIEDAVVLRLQEMETFVDAAKNKAVGWFRSVHLAMRSAVYAVSIDTGIGVEFSAKDAIDRAKELETQQEELVRQQKDPNSEVWKSYIKRSVTIAALRSMKANDTQLDEVRPGEAKCVPRVVVFIDDMDRCSSKDAFKILQGIKLAFAQPGFVFILSLNPETLRPYIAEQANLARRDAKDLSEAIYLDKLVQLPYPLKLRDDQFQKFAHTLVEERLTNLVSAEQHALFKNLRSALRDSSDRNPRTLKRLINALIVDARQAPAMLLKRLNEDDAKARADFMGLSLLDQTPRHFGKPGLLSQLSEAPGLCELIIRDGLRPTFKRLSEVRAVEQKRQRTLQGGGSHAGVTNAEAATILQYADLLTGLNAVPPLDGLFRASFGRRWLAEAAIREEFSRFLALRPVEVELPSAPASQADASIEQASKDSPATSEEERTAAFKKAVQRFKQSERRKKKKESATAPRADLVLSDAERAIIERAARESLQLPESADLTREDWGRITELNVQGEALTDAGAAFLARADSGLTSLTTLDLTGTQVTDAGVTALARADSGLKSLTTLNLWRTQVTDAGVMALARADSGLKSLTTLNLSGTQVTDAGVAALVRADSGLKSLTALNLTNTPVTDAGVTALARAESGLQFLATLSLRDTQVTDAGVAALARPDSGLKSLTTLDLGGTAVADAGVTALARADSGLKFLTWLNLWNTAVADAGVTALACADSGLKSLTALDLYETHVTDAGVRALARADSSLTSLTTLDLGYTKVTDAGVTALARADSGLKSLITLNLGRTPVTDAGVAALARADSGLKSLTTLDLYGTQVTEAGRTAVRARWPNIKITG